MKEALQPKERKKNRNSDKQYPPPHSPMARRRSQSTYLRYSSKQGLNWDLPSELLSLIVSKCTTSANEYVSFRQVCREWRRCLTDYSPLPPLPSPQIPFLLYTSNLGSALGYVFPLPFSSPRRKPTTISPPHLKETHGRICVGSSHGWIITLSLDSSISLLNPVTGDSFHLPPLSSIDKKVLYFDPRSYPEYRLPQKRRVRSQTTLIHRAVLSSDPVKDSGFTVLLFFSGLTDCCFTWTKDTITWRQHLYEHFEVQDVIFFNGVFVAVDLSVNIAIFDFKNLDTGLVMRRQNDVVGMSPKEAFLVEAKSKLLLVVKGGPSKQRRLPRDFMRVFEIDTLGHAHEIRLLLHCSLFVGHCCSVSVSKSLLPWLAAEGKVYFPRVYPISATDENGRKATLHHACMYEFSVTSRFTHKAFAIETVSCAPFWKHQMKFFWVTPNLNRK